MVYPRDAVRLLCRLAVLAGAERVVAIARFGPKTRALVRRFRPFTEATPSHDQRGARVAALDAQTFQPCFVSWGAAFTGAPAAVMAIAGKTLRRSDQKRGGKAPIPMGCAVAAQHRLVLGHVKVAAQANEIVAIPRRSWRSQDCWR